MLSVVAVASCSTSPENTSETARADCADEPATAVDFTACADSATQDATVATTAGPDDNTGDGGTGVCALLTVADLEAVGLTVTAGPAPDAAVPGDECVFELPLAESSVVPGRLTVWMHPAAFGAALGPELYVDSVEVQGVGVQAWSSSLNGLAETRLNDGRVIGVQLAATGPGDASNRAVQLLAVAAGRA